MRAGYDMDIIPTDLATYGEEAQNLLQDLQSRNERMFLVSMNIDDEQYWFLPLEDKYNA